jgi:hypothetical protein
MTDEDEAKDEAKDEAGQSEGALLQELSQDWSRTLAQFLIRLPRELLAEVFEGAAPRTRTRAVEHLGLTKRWRALKRRGTGRPGVKDLNLLAREIEVHQKALDSLSHGGAIDADDEAKCVMAAMIVFSWWSRSARNCFAGTNLGTSLKQQPLTSALAMAVLRARADGLTNEEKERHEAYRESSEVLKRVTAGIFDLAIEGANGATILGALDDWVGPLTRGVDSAITLPNESLAPERASQVAKDQRKQKKKKKREHPPQTESVGPVGAELFSDIPAFETLNHFHEQSRSLWGALKKSTDTADVVKANDVASQLQALRPEIKQELDGLGAKSDPETLIDAVMGSGEAFGTALSPLAMEWRRRAATTTAELAQSVTEFKQELERYGIPPPPKLEECSSQDEFDELWKKYAPRLDTERVFASLEGSEQPTKQFQDLRPSDRLEGYRRCNARNDEATRLLRWLIGDVEAVTVKDGQGDELYSAVLRRAVDGFRQLPSGVWRTFKDLFGEDAEDELLSSGLCEAFVRKAQDSFQSLELTKTLDVTRSEFPVALQHALARVAAERESPDQRVVTLAKLALKPYETVGISGLPQKFEPLTLNALSTALLESGRTSESVTLGLWRDVIPSESSDEASPDSYTDGAIAQHQRERDALLCVLLEAADGDEPRRTLLQQLINDNPSWLTESPTEAIVLLALSANTETSGVLPQLQYADSSVLESAKEERPALVTEWLLKRVHQKVPRLTEAQFEIIRNGTDALIEFRHQLERRTVWTGAVAASYQREFNSRLCDAEKRIRVHKEKPGWTGTELLEEVERLDLQGVHKRARRKMLEYLDAQLDRLEAIFEAVVVGGPEFETTQAMTDEELRAALQLELEDTRPASPLRIVYKRALEQL